MKRVPPSGYVCADDSRQPGYLERKFKRMRAQQKANEAEAKAKVKPLIKAKA